MLPGTRSVLSSSLLASLLASGAALVALAACGSVSGTSVFADPPPLANQTPGPTDPLADAGLDGEGGATGDGGTCATVAAEATLTPVNLVVMYDQSGSMGDTTEDPSFDPTLRWVPVGQAMKAFFGDAQSAGLRAALTFFPNATNSCLSADYATAEVALTALPAAVFSTTITAHAPKGDTPTRAAAASAVAQAKAIAASHPGEKTAIVLVTDGEPYGCGINDATMSNAEIVLVAADVAAVAATIPTYVVGVGPSVQHLDAVATAGGTTAFKVQVGSAAQTTQQLLAAMAQIRGALGKCDFDVPKPPDGRQLDYGKVNVEVVHPGAPTETLAYSADCATGKGWHFDDPNSPKKVLLCGSTCDVVKAEAGGKVLVAFACVDRPDVVR
jgi:hypothetical protein